MPLVVETVLPTAEKKSLVGECDLLTTARESNASVFIFYFLTFLLERTVLLKRMGTLINLWLETAALQLAPLAQNGRTVPSEPIAHAEDQVVDAVRCGAVVTFARTIRCDKCACSCRLDEGKGGGGLSYKST